MKKNYILYFLTILIITFSFLTASANSLAPDRSQLVLDLLAVECQNISDYSTMAQYGDTSRFNAVKEHIAVTINNISLLMNGYDDSSINAMWNMYNTFSPDSGSAQSAADACAMIRGDIYRKISGDSMLNQRNTQIGSYDECVRAGYYVKGGTCFIGGSFVYDHKGNIIGFYYSDCFDNGGYHMGSCWDCYYGADNEGCIAKP